MPVRRPEGRTAQPGLVADITCLPMRRGFLHLVAIRVVIARSAALAPGESSSLRHTIHPMVIRRGKAAGIPVSLTQ